MQYVKLQRKTVMEEIIKTLRKRPSGHGHFYISVELDNKEISTLTTNTLAIDAAFDEYYDDEDNSERYYINRREAQESLVNEILIKNTINI